MNQAIQIQEHAPASCMGILGCDGYPNADKIICLYASAHNNFISEGIVEGSLVFVDTDCDCLRGNLNVYRRLNCREPQYKLSRKEIPQAAFVGKVLMAVNQF